MTHAVAAAAMSSAAINDLPDEAFAFIESGGTKDSEGKTTPRSLRHFPVHDEAHARNALARMSQSPFGKKAEAKIRAACKRFGIRWAGMDKGGSKGEAYAASAAQMLGVELARPGTWHLGVGGKRTFTSEDLKDAADFFAASGQARVPLGFGHADKRFDGDPAFGWVSNIRYTEDGKGPVLLGDLVDMDDWVAAAAPSRWPNRSIEGFANLDWNGRTYRLVVNRLALLGSTPPAMPTLRSLADLREAIAAAAEDSGAELIAASALDGEPDEPEELSDEDIQDPAPEAVVPPSEVKEAGMDPAKIRERLGLDDDVSDDDVMEALAYAGFVPADEAPETAPAPVAASAAKARKPETFSGSMIKVEASAWEENQERIKRLEAEAKRRRDDDRDQIIAEAVMEGKFAPSRREHWAHNWDLDPEGAREAIASMQRNMIPVAASGYSDDAEREDDDLDREIARLSDPSRRKGA